ncbi:hypothetical protein Ddc_11266 [Ditylenchus destructor]|nr:hypothetical protein Ddc_11266 [Ditylenchus destructor]
MSAYDHIEQDPSLENTEFSASAAKTEGGHEDIDYPYSRTHYGFENEDHDALGAHVMSTIGENEATGVEPEICALTPEVLDQAPEAEDKFAGAPGLDLDAMAAVNDKKHKEENESNLNGKHI